MVVIVVGGGTTSGGGGGRRGKTGWVEIGVEEGRVDTQGIVRHAKS